MSKSRIINFTLEIDKKNPHSPVIDSEINNPTVIRIHPIEKVEIENGIPIRKIDFRVAFEPQNCKRREQPLRKNIEPIFPDGKKYPETL
jgi:hypothetical protein